jgi:hypothetical protein
MTRKHGLGRLLAPDNRDRRFPMGAMVKPVPEQSIMHRPGRVLDQGQTSSCVGHAWRAWLEASPIRERPTESLDALQIYAQAQELDEFPGIEPEIQGSSVRAGAMLMQNIGRVQGYAWGFHTRDVVTYLIERGPVVLGLNWYAGMDAPDSRGIAHLEGDVEGGHAFLCYGFHLDEQLFRCQNSWGREWGHSGRFWLRRDDLERLIAEDGEVCGAAELPLIRLKKEAA